MPHRKAVKEDLTFRHELKYLITPKDAHILKQRLGALIAKDENISSDGFYKVRSLYFDDYWGSAYEEKLMGVASRSKYRIRVYNDSDKTIRLERKLKQGIFVSKQAAELTRDETERIIQGDYSFLLENPQQLCREFYYECIARVMRPRVMVDYEREPYVFLPGDVRITFDQDVRATVLSYDLFDSDLPAINVLDPGQMVLEVKYTEFLPELFRKVLPQRTSQVMAVSKYILSCDRTMFISSHLS